MEKKRLDVLLVERGLVETREKAQALILSGAVLVDDVPATKSGIKISIESNLRVRGTEHPYVSRGALKLIAALDEFGISVKNRRAIDVGASTGGFTEVLLNRGVQDVVTLDVGTNQLHWKIRSDPRVKVFEKTNARYIQSNFLDYQVDLVVMDVSFISVTKIVPALIPFVKPEADWIILIKPQFEVGREGVGAGGIVRNAKDRERAVEEVTQSLKELGLQRLKLIESPIKGMDGNIEFLALYQSK